MADEQSASRYPQSMRRLHWAIFVLVLVGYVLGNIFDWFPRRTPERINILGAHYLVGICVLLLTLPRFWLRKQHGSPPIAPPLDRWTNLLAKLTHYAMYAFLLIQPLLGIITLQNSGKSITLFGVTLLPSLVATPDRDLGHWFEDIHVTVAEVFYWVIGLHILAALWHHFIRRDDTLKRML